MTTKPELMLEGEPVRLIVEALASLMENSYEEEGWLRIEGSLAGDSGAAFVHAWGRIDAELQAADMRSRLSGGIPDERTDEQRGADALLVLVERLSEVLGIDIPRLPTRTRVGGPDLSASRR